MLVFTSGGDLTIVQLAVLRAVTCSFNRYWSGDRRGQTDDDRAPGGVGLVVSTESNAAGGRTYRGRVDESQPAAVAARAAEGLDDPVNSSSVPVQTCGFYRA